MPRRSIILFALSLALGLSLAAVAPASARPARPTLSAPTAAVSPGTVVTLRGTAPARARVVLHRKDGGRWTKLARQRSDRAGRVVFRVDAVAAGYRVSAGRRHSEVVRVRVAPAPGPVPGVTPPPGPRTAALSAPSATDPHTTLPVTVAMSPARPGTPLVLEGLVDGTWRRVASGVEDGSGRVSLLVTPGTTTTYRVAGHSSGPTATIEVRPARTTPWVTGYYAGWFWDQEYAPHEVDMADMTHFVFGRVAPGGGSLDGAPGEVVPGAGTAHQRAASPYPGVTVEDYLVRRARAAGAEALLMLGGDGFDGRGFVASTDDAVRPAFVRNLVDYLVAHDYDGVDVDWENCLGGEAWECGIDITTEEAVRRLEALVVEVRAEMATRPRYAHDPGLVTFPGYPVNTNWIGAGVPDWQARLPWLVDQYNLMSYGIGTTWNRDGWHSWFSGALDDESPSTPVSIDSSIDAYVAGGAPREKMGMGIGFYGIYYGPGITGPRQSTEDNHVYEVNDVALSWSRLVTLGYLSHGTRHFDAAASSTYRTYGAGGYVPPADPARSAAGFLSYEDEESIAAKAAYTRAGGAGGTILWTLNYGADPDGGNPLLDAVGEHFLGR